MEKISKLTPLETVRTYCQQCLGIKQFNTDQVRDCEGDAVKCPFFTYRLGKRPPVRIFRKFCIDCMGGQPAFVKDCPATTCQVFPYRMGKNPARLGSQLRGIALQKKIVKEGAGGLFKRQESTIGG